MILEPLLEKRFMPGASASLKKFWIFFASNVIRITAVQHRAIIGSSEGELSPG